MRISFPGICVVLLLLTSAARSEWTKPPDEVFTEKQLTGYLAVSKEWIAAMKEAKKPVDGSQAGLNVLIVYTRNNAKFKDSLAKNELEQPEFNWVGARAWDAWSALVVDETVKKMDAEVAAETKKNTDRVARDQAWLATYQQALAVGRQVMTPQERAAAIKQAQADQRSAADEVAEHSQDARSAAADAARSEAEANQDAAIANSPPADLNDDDKANFVAAKMAEAQAAADLAQEDRMKASDAREAQAAAQVKSDAAAAHVRQPDVPQTDEERAAAKEKNQQIIAQLQAEMAAAQDALKLLADNGDAARNEILQQRPKVPDANVALMKQHRQDFADVWHPRPPAQAR
jgi:hypothetical protein